MPELNTLFDKYVPAGLDLILEGLVDGRQEAKIKTIVPLTSLNMVNTRGLVAQFLSPYWNVSRDVSASAIYVCS